MEEAGCLLVLEFCEELRFDLSLVKSDLYASAGFRLILPSAEYEYLTY